LQIINGKIYQAIDKFYIPVLLYGVTLYCRCNEEKSKSSKALTESSWAIARLRWSREQTTEDGLGAFRGEQVYTDLLAVDGSVRYNAEE
jgi:hypothetical protein